jgi:hypothetical protein
MAVAGPHSAEDRDVLVGDVWICSGQLNMEMSVAGAMNAKAEIAAAAHPPTQGGTQLVPRADGSALPGDLGNYSLPLLLEEPFSQCAHEVCMGGSICEHGWRGDLPCLWFGFWP